MGNIQRHNTNLKEYIERHNMNIKLLQKHPEKSEMLKIKIDAADKAIMEIVTSDYYIANPSMNVTLEYIQRIEREKQ